MPPSSLPAQGGHCWSTHNFKDPTGSEGHRETIFPPSTSIKSTGWENLLRISPRAELSFWRASSKKFKPLLIPYFQEPSSRKLEATLSSWELKSSTMILNSNSISWPNSPILTLGLKSQPNVPSSTSSSQKAALKISYSPWSSTSRRTNCKSKSKNLWKSKMSSRWS